MTGLWRLLLWIGGVSILQQVNTRNASVGLNGDVLVRVPACLEPDEPLTEQDVSVSHLQPVIANEHIVAVGIGLPCPACLRQETQLLVL